MKIVKILGVVALVYVGIVVLFESLIGYFQPQDDSTLIITTQTDGEQSSRVLTAIDDAGRLYVAVNHWPRAWYRAVRENPQVRITRNGRTADYIARPVSEAEYRRLNEEVRPLPLFIRFLTGFPPREFVRLDPAASPDQPAEQAS